MKKLNLPSNTHFIVVALVIGMILGFCGQQLFQKYHAHRILTSDEATMEALDQIIVLPDERPTIATVSDKEKLSNEPFFQEAENGDRVIMFKESGLAYLFRPSEQKIINFTTLNIGASE